MSLSAVMERSLVRPFTEFELSDGQKLALMVVWRTKLALAVHNKMLASGHARPSQHDFAAVSKAGLIEKQSVVAYYTTTAIGRVTAHAIAFDLGAQFRLHVTHYEDSSNGTRVSCPCGWSIFAPKTQTGYATYIARHAAAHCDSPAKDFVYAGAQ